MTGPAPHEHRWVDFDFPREDGSVTQWCPPCGEKREKAGRPALNPQRVSYALSHLRAAAAVLREQGLDAAADAAGALADEVDRASARSRGHAGTGGG